MNDTLPPLYATFNDLMRGRKTQEPEKDLLAFDDALEQALSYCWKLLGCVDSGDLDDHLSFRSMYVPAYNSGHGNECPAIEAEILTRTRMGTMFMKRALTRTNTEALEADFGDESKFRLAVFSGDEAYNGEWSSLSATHLCPKQKASLGFLFALRSGGVVR